MGDFDIGIGNVDFPVIFTFLHVPRVSKQLPKSLRVKDREYSLPPKTSLCQTLTNEVHKTSCIETIYQVGVQNTRDNILIELFIQLINEPCFNILRTQEQLGYIVWR